MIKGIFIDAALVVVLGGRDSHNLFVAAQLELLVAECCKLHIVLALLQEVANLHVEDLIRQLSDHPHDRLCVELLHLGRVDFEQTPHLLHYSLHLSLIGQRLSFVSLRLIDAVVVAEGRL